eukprot:2605211-Rhodomonas_salina.2
MPATGRDPRTSLCVTHGLVVDFTFATDQCTKLARQNPPPALSHTTLIDLFLPLQHELWRLAGRAQNQEEIRR